LSRRLPILVLTACPTGGRIRKPINELGRNEREKKWFGKQRRKGEDWRSTPIRTQYTLTTPAHFQEKKKENQETRQNKQQLHRNKGQGVKKKQCGGLVYSRSNCEKVRKMKKKKRAKRKQHTKK
jgi:hypothetical protein